MANKTPLKGLFDGGNNAVGLSEFNSTDTIGASARTVVTVADYSATPAINWSGSDVVRITLTGNMTPTMTGAVDGQKCILEIIQDATGSRTATWTNATLRYGTDITSITLSTAANKIDRVGFIYNASANKYDVVAVVKGF
jgi:hypothetical protein